MTARFSVGGDEGFGLIQVILLIVVLGLALAAGMQMATSAMEAAYRQETVSEMEEIAHAISGNPDLYANGMRLDFGYLGDVGNLPLTLESLVTNPGYSTWRGPYVQSDYSNYNEDYLYDAWGGHYLLAGSRIMSITPAGDTIEVALARNISQLLGNSIAGEVTNSAGDAPGAQSINIQIILSYPNGAGSMTDTTLTPASDGIFSFGGFVPCGNHRLRAILTTANDTSETMVSVLPGSNANVVLRLGSLPIAMAPADAVAPNLEYSVRRYLLEEVVRS